MCSDGFSGYRCYDFFFSSFFGKNNPPCFPLALLIVPMIRNHKWEWGPPTHRRHPALPCHRCTMPPQTLLRLLNLTGCSLPTSLHPSPCKTTASLWITGKTQKVFQLWLPLSCTGYYWLPAHSYSLLGWGMKVEASKVHSVRNVCVYERLAPGLVH